MEPEIVTVLPSPRRMAVRAVMRGFKRVPRNPSLPVQTLLLPEITLKEEDVAAYSLVCGFTHLQGVPITWPHLLAFPLHLRLMLKSEFPFPVIGLVHLGNSIKQHEALFIGQTLAVSVKAGKFKRHEKGQAFTMKTSVEAYGRVVWESVSTYLRLGVREPSGKEFQGLAGVPELEDVSETWELTKDLGKRYARISGDNNPIHTSKAGARLFGFKRPIVHGMWSKARALASLLPQQPVVSASVKVNFKKPAYLPGKADFLVQKNNRRTIFEMREQQSKVPHLCGVLSV